MQKRKPPAKRRRRVPPCRAKEHNPLNRDCTCIWKENKDRKVPEGVINHGEGKKNRKRRQALLKTEPGLRRAPSAAAAGTGTPGDKTPLTGEAGCETLRPMPEAPRPNGRPRKFESPEELWDRGQTWMTEQKAAGGPLTVTGLALALGTTRETLMDYERGKYDPKEGETFSETMKLLKTHVENFAEQRLYTGNATGPIFALKNFGWTDQQDHRHSGELTTKVVRVLGPEKKPEGHGSPG